MVYVCNIVTDVNREMNIRNIGDKDMKNTVIATIVGLTLTTAVFAQAARVATKDVVRERSLSFEVIRTLPAEMQKQVMKSEAFRNLELSLQVGNTGLSVREAAEQFAQELAVEKGVNANIGAAVKTAVNNYVAQETVTGLNNLDISLTDSCSASLALKASRQSFDPAVMPGLSNMRKVIGETDSALLPFGGDVVDGVAYAMTNRIPDAMDGFDFLTTVTREAALKALEDGVQLAQDRASITNARMREIGARLGKEGAEEWSQKCDSRLFVWN